MHRDVKPENIFLSEDHKVLKLGDFGLARATEGTRSTKTEIGSYRYMAPEVMSSGGHYSEKSDVYSFGLCLIEVVSGKPVFDDIENDKRVFYNKVSGAKPNIPVISEAKFEEVTRKIKTIIDECLKTEEFRAEMHIVLSILRTPSTIHRKEMGPYSEATKTGQTAMKAVRDGLMSSVPTDSQSGQQCSDAGSAPYPSIKKAFRDDRTTSSATEYRPDQQFSDRSDLHCSPITMQAFKDDPTSPSMDTDNRSEEQRPYGSDSPYPTVKQAFKEDPTTNSRSQERCADPLNSPYPPFVQAFRNDPTSLSSCSNRSTGQHSSGSEQPLKEVVTTESRSHERSADRSGSPYPPIGQTFRDDLSSISSGHSRSVGQPGSPYPTVEQAFKDVP